MSSVSSFSSSVSFSSRRRALRSSTSRFSRRIASARSIASCTIAAYLTIDRGGGFLGIIALALRRRQIGPGQVRARIAIISHAAEPLRHAVARHHRARDVGDAPQVVGGSGGEMLEHRELGGAPAEQDRHLVLQLLAGHQEAVLGRTLNGIAERTDATRYDRYFVHGIGPRQRHRHQRVAHLVVGDDLAFLRIEQPVALLEPCHDAFNRVGEIRHCHGIGTAPGREQCRLVDKIGEVRAGEAGCEGCDLVGIDLRREFRFLEMDPQDIGAPLLVGSVHQHLAIEAARPQQRRIENLRPIGGRQHHQAGPGIEAVHLDQQLIERLLLLVMVRRKARCRGRARARRARQ